MYNSISVCSIDLKMILNLTVQIEIVFKFLFCLNDLIFIILFFKLLVYFDNLSVVIIK